jgi:hypothetical protein
MSALYNLPKGTRPAWWESAARGCATWLDIILQNPGLPSDVLEPIFDATVFICRRWEAARHLWQVDNPEQALALRVWPQLYAYVMKPLKKDATIVLIHPQRRSGYRLRIRKCRTMRELELFIVVELAKVGCVWAMPSANHSMDMEFYNWYAWTRMGRLLPEMGMDAGCIEFPSDVAPFRGEKVLLVHTDPAVPLREDVSPNPSACCEPMASEEVERLLKTFEETSLPVRMEAIGDEVARTGRQYWAKRFGALVLLGEKYGPRLGYSPFPDVHTGAVTLQPLTEADMWRRRDVFFGPMFGERLPREFFVQLRCEWCAHVRERSAMTRNSCGAARDACLLLLEALYGDLIAGTIPTDLVSDALVFRGTRQNAPIASCRVCSCTYFTDRPLLDEEEESSSVGQEESEEGDREGEGESGDEANNGDVGQRVADAFMRAGANWNGGDNQEGGGGFVFGGGDAAAPFAFGGPQAFNPFPAGDPRFAADAPAIAGPPALAAAFNFVRPAAASAPFVFDAPAEGAAAFKFEFDDQAFGFAPGK